MRTAFLIATFALVLKITLAANATVNESQEQKADQLCNTNPTYCK